MNVKKRILLKLTGEIFTDKKTDNLNTQAIDTVIEQIKHLNNTYQFGIVVGGGNFFRGNQHGKKLGLKPAIGHTVGMIATMMNGVILQDLLSQAELPSTLFCALPCVQIGESISSQAIAHALEKNHILIFTGGTGNPYFTTDTNAILRALQMESNEVFKATNVDGVYNKNPQKYGDAQLLKQVSFDQVLEKKLEIMDTTAYVLAQENNIIIRVFNIFSDDALIQAIKDLNFGSTIQ